MCDLIAKNGNLVLFHYFFSLYVIIKRWNVCSIKTNCYNTSKAWTFVTRRGVVNWRDTSLFNCRFRLHLWPINTAASYTANYIGEIVFFLKYRCHQQRSWIQVYVESIHPPPASTVLSMFLERAHITEGSCLTNEMIWKSLLLYHTVVPLQKQIRE